MLGLLAARRLGLDTASEAAGGRARRRSTASLPADLRRQVEALRARRSGSPPAPASGAPVPARDRPHARRRRPAAGRRVRADLSLLHRRDLAARPELRSACRRPRGPAGTSPPTTTAARPSARSASDRMTRASRWARPTRPFFPRASTPSPRVSASLARAPWTWEVEVVLDLPLEQRRRPRPRDPRQSSARSTAGRSCACASSRSRLDWPACSAGLGCGFRRPRARTRFRASVRAPRRPPRCRARLAAGSGQASGACPDVSRRRACLLIPLTEWKRSAAVRDDGDLLPPRVPRRSRCHRADDGGPIWRRRPRPPACGPASSAGPTGPRTWIVGRRRRPSWCAGPCASSSTATSTAAPRPTSPPASASAPGTSAGCFGEHVGATPDQVARSPRAHFARRLLDDTDLSLTDIAFAAGFGSVRQFNRTMQDTFRASPRELRARRRKADRLTADGGPSPAPPLRRPPGLAGALSGSAGGRSTGPRWSTARPTGARSWSTASRA